MESLRGVVETYVASMRPRGEELAAALRGFLAAGAPLGEADAVIAGIHKFAGSAGSAGFLRLSAVAALIEIGLRAAVAAGGVDPLTAAQIGCLGEDFAAEIAALAPEASSLVDAAKDAPSYAYFDRPLRVMLVGLPEPVTRILSHVVEQMMGMSWSFPDAAVLASLAPGRAPDFAVTAEAVSGLSFPVVAFVPRGFDGIAADWPRG